MKKLTNYFLITYLIIIFNEHIANHIGKILFNYKELNKLEELFILIKLNDSNYQKEKKKIFVFYSRKILRVFK